MRSGILSIDEYAGLCARTDLSPGFDPVFVEFYFGRIGEKPRIVGKFTRSGELVAAFPVLLRQVFPNSLHKRLLGRKAVRLGDIGQPESLFPVLPSATQVPLRHLSPTTSPILAGRIRGFNGASLRRVAIAKDRRHKKVTHRQKVFFESGGEAFFTNSMGPREFADIYIRLHSERWGYCADDLRFVRDQILGLYDGVFGVVLTHHGEPVAAQLCHIVVGASLLYVDFVNSGVKLTEDHDVSYGSIMMLTTLRRAEEKARSLGKSLRFSFGYFYGAGGYKSVWSDPEATYVGF